MEQHFKLSRRVSVTIGCVAGSRSRPLHPGNRIRLDGLRFYLYLSIGAGLAGIMFFWVYGSDFAKKEAEKGRPKPLGPWFRFMTAYVFCGLTIAVFILGIIFGGIG